VRFESVDNWHEAWETVLHSVEKHGSRRKLRIDADGWLSSRQVLMVAFVGNVPAAHICFSVNPTKSGRIEAALESFGIDPRCAGRGIEAELHRATVKRARSMRCLNLVGWALPISFHHSRPRPRSLALH
jgi:hypothetical protein